MARGLFTAGEAAGGSLRERARRLLSALRSATVDVAYPPLCIACREVVGREASLCPRCWARMRFISRPYCERLGTPFAVDIGGPLLSPAAIADPPVFARARSVAVHEGVARELVHRLKYQDRTDLAVAMARLMSQAGGELLAGSPLICPVPLHWSRSFSRRFNQSALLARELARLADGRFEPGLLRRRKRTRQQVGLTRNQRRENLQGAFVVPDERRPQLAGRWVLLVDDVLTTGATVNAAARVLLRAGAEAVDVLTFSRVVGET
jgi:ComF family protein